MKPSPIPLAVCIARTALGFELGSIIDLVRRFDCTVVDAAFSEARWGVMRMTTFAAALLLALGGCDGNALHEAMIIGFPPIDPPTGHRLIRPFEGTHLGPACNHSPPIIEPLVDSLQPTLKWEGMPGRDDTSDRFIPFVLFTGFNIVRRPLITESEERISDVTFELEVYEADEDRRSANLAYRREGLVATEAKIETPLKPRQPYLWTVRASYLLNGEPRKSPWSQIKSVRPDCSLYRFRTPNAPR